METHVMEQSRNNNNCAVRSREKFGTMAMETHEMILKTYKMIP